MQLRHLPALLTFAVALSAHAQSSKTASILDFGAIPDGTTLNTAAIQKAIDKLAADGGGTLVIPASEKPFLSGALFLKPKVNLQVDKGATLKGSVDVKDYPTTKTRIEGHFEDWLPALINAVDCDNLTITGEGTLDGSGTPFYAAFRAARAKERGTKNLDVPRPRLLFIQHANNLTVKGLHLLNSGFWNLHVYNCDGVTIDGLDISAPAGSPSTDGIDVDSSRNVLITNCSISNNDDCIALKGSKGQDALNDKSSPPVENITVTNCTFTMGGSVVTCGSEATIVRNVKVDNCTVVGPNTRGINVLRLKLRTDTPQTYENIHYTNITLDGVGTLINVSPWSQYETLNGQPRPAHTVRNISLKDIKGKFGNFGQISPLPGDTIDNFTLENVDVQLANPTPKFAGITNFQAINVKINGAEVTPTITPAPTTRPGRNAATAPATLP